MSIAGGVQNAPAEAARIGAKAFALFTGNNMRWHSKGITPKVAEQFKHDCELYGFSPKVILPHDNFLINLGSPDAEKLEKSRSSFIEEMQRCEMLGLTMLNFHPGSHLKLMETDACLDLIADSINLALEHTTGVTAVIENTAGQGSNLGHEFEQIARIISRVEDKSRVGICVDTCHTYSAGYDLRTPEGYEETWRKLDEVIGMHYLRGMHINDDKRECGSRIDRHESIGEGTLGPEFFTRLMNDPRFDDIPLILETPDEARWPEEIAWLYSQISS